MDMTPGKPFLHRRGKSGLHIAGKVFFSQWEALLDKIFPSSFSFDCATKGHVDLHVHAHKKGGAVAF